MGGGQEKPYTVQDQNLNIYIVKSQTSAHSNINTFKYKLWLKFCQSCNDLSLKKKRASDVMGVEISKHDNVLHHPRQLQP